MINNEVTIEDLQMILGYGSENIMELLYRLKNTGNKINGEDLKNLIYRSLTKGVSDWQKTLKKKKVKK